MSTLRTAARKPSALRWIGALALLSASSYAPSSLALQCQTCPPEDAGDPAPTPYTPPSTEKQIDALVNEVLSERQLPGIGLSITRYGQPIYSNGYGKADVAGNKPMTADTRTLIGSVTKAIVTGPTGFRMLEERHIEPSTQKVYGDDGLLGNDFAGALGVGIERHTPIAEMDIAPDDRVYTWYQNGTVSVGSSNDLGRYVAPTAFSLPAGQRVTDLRAVGIASNSRVYSWFEDSRTCGCDDASLYRAIGTSTDLDAYSPGTLPKVTLPAGYTAHDVVGVAIAKSNDHVYVWYQDGKVSQGTSTDFAYYAEPAPYTTASQIKGTPRHIRGIGIASDDRVYTWFASGKATIGRSTDLGAYYAPYAYTLPALANLPDWKQWYADLTVQNLLDHRGGFTRSPDMAGAARHYGTTEEELSYQQIHSYFLSTRKLLYKPDGGYNYSNHGFGLWTLMIPAATGIDFKTYARTNYLEPLGLANDIVASGTSLVASRDAKNYVLSGNTYVEQAPRDYGTGLAAGGYRGSAKGLTKAMWAQASRYSYTCLNQMGWGTGDRGELQHFGALGGGMSFVTIYPQGFTSASGKDLGGLQIALVANRWARPSRFDELRDAIAEKVASIQVPAPAGPALSGFQLSCQSE